MCVRGGVCWLAVSVEGEDEGETEMRVLVLIEDVERLYCAHVSSNTHARSRGDAKSGVGVESNMMHVLAGSW